MENEQIVDEASEWFVALREGVADQATQSRFMTWLCRSPEHVRVYLDIVALWSDVPALPVREGTDADALIARARAQHNVVALGPRVGEDLVVVPGPLSGADLVAPGARAGDNSAESSAGAHPPRIAPGASTRKLRAWRAIAACAVLALALFGVGAWLTRVPTFEAAVGEQRTLRLADGSIVDLNSRSRIRVHFSDTQRGVELVEGQALFRVAKDPNRVFVVSSGTARVRAVGTQFDVNRRGEGTIVTVVEGRVAVASSARDLQAAGPAETKPGSASSSSTLELASAEVLLSAGQQLTVNRTSPFAPKAADVAEVTAWRRGVLVFSSEPLSVVVDEFNRYNPRRILLDSSVEDFPVTATFASTDSTALVSFLQTQPDLHVDVADLEIRVRSINAGSAKK